MWCWDHQSIFLSAIIMFLRSVRGYRNQLIPLRRYTNDITGASPKPFSEIPSPSGALPVLGHYFKTRNGLSKNVEKMFQEINGPIFKINVFGNYIVFTNDPASVKTIVDFEGKYPLRSIEENLQWFYKQRNEKPILPFQSGPKWREERTRIGKQVTPANVYGYVPGFNKATDRLFRNIQEMRESDGHVKDIEELVMYWSLEVGAYFCFGADLDVKNDHDSEAVELKEAMTVIVNAIDDFTNSLPYYKIFPSKFVRDANKANDTMNRIGKKYADQYMDHIMKGVDNGEKQSGQSLLEQWLIEGKLSKEDAIANAATMMGAGMDTTANAVAFMLYELSTHKTVQDKLHDQVLSVLGKDGEPDFESLQKMPYLMNIIKETMRVSSVIPSFGRQISEDAVILGYSVPAGTICIYSMNSAKKNSEIFIEPDRFNPDRWSTDEPNPLASVPFGVGPRSCWGRRFAEIEMKVLLAKLSQSFIMESNHSEGTRLPYKEKAIFRPAKKISIKFINRN